LEFEGECLISIESGRRKLLLRTHDVVRNVVSIRPGNSRTEFDGHRLGDEGEVVDFDLGCAGGAFELARAVAVIEGVESTTASVWLPAT